MKDNELTKIIESLKNRNMDYEMDAIYILPEYIDGSTDVLNGLSPNINKILLLDKNNSKIVYNKEDFTYLTLNDADIIFPLLFNIPIGLVTNLIVHYIDRILKKSKSKSNIKVKFISKETNKEKHKQYELEGDAKYVIEALKILEKGDDYNERL